VTNEVTCDELTAGGQDRIPGLVGTGRRVRVCGSDVVVVYL
jgi:hypothetical protein